jgi:hypothetical protein
MHIYPLFVTAFCALVVAYSSNGENNDPERRHPEVLHAEHTHIFPVPAELPTHPVDMIKRAIEPRLDIPGIDLDDLASQVWDKVKSEVTDAVDAGKKGFDDAVDAAERAFNAVVDAAKEVIDDIKNGVEEIWQEIKAKVAELEDMVFIAIHDWIHENIIEPLIKLLIILSLPFAILLLWWMLYHIAKPIDNRRQNKPKTSVELLGLDRHGCNVLSSTRNADERQIKKKGSSNWAGLLVRSWEGSVQGLLCLICPWYGSFTLWKSRKEEKKKARKFKARVDDLELEVKYLIQQLKAREFLPREYRGLKTEND